MNIVLKGLYYYISLSADGFFKFSGCVVDKKKKQKDYTCFYECSESRIKKHCYDLKTSREYVSRDAISLICVFR